MLELRKISFEVKSGSRKKILDQISLKIKSGALIAITGPNGSGKSTLAEIIMGLKKPTSGNILLDSNDITKDDITARAKAGISLSFQQPVKFKGLTVYELLNIASGELISPDDAGKILKKVGLSADDYLGREVNDKLSGGELKRIEIATVLARNARVIVFDEPEAGIDLWSFNDLTKVIKTLHQNNPDESIIIISHQERILKKVDEIIVLNKGKIQHRGTPNEIMPLIAREGK